MNTRRYFGQDEKGNLIRLPNVICLECGWKLDALTPDSGWFDQDEIDAHQETHGSPS